MNNGMSANHLYSNNGLVNLDQYRSAMTMAEILRDAGGIEVNGNRMIRLRDEKTASCRVYDYHLYDFGNGQYLDTIGAVQFFLDCTFLEAILWIAVQAGLPTPQISQEAQKTYEAVQFIASVYSQVFHDALQNPKPGLAYLDKRRISQETTEGQVGYLPANYEPTDLDSTKRAGCYSTKGNFLFSDRLVIPIMQHGQIVSLYGRALDHERKPPHIYPASTDPLMPATLWNLDPCRNQKEIYLAEGIIDGLTLVDRGFTNTAALFGTQGLTDARLEALKRTQIEKVILCLDSDGNESGQKAALRTGEKLFRAGYEVEIINLPLADGQEKTDPNSYFQDHAPDDFRELPRRDVFDCLLDTIPRDGPPQQRYKALVPVLKLVAEQPELTWKEYVSGINKRFPEYDKRKLEKAVSEQRKASGEQEGLTEKFLPTAYVEQIRTETPVIAYDGRIYRYEGGAYRPWYSEEIDQKTIQLYGPEVQPKHLHAVREFTESICFVRPETVNPRGLLNLQNGIMDIVSGEFLDHSPERLFTVQAQTSFDQKAECPIFLETIAQIFPDTGSRLLLAQSIGDSLSADNSHHKGLILVGDGANGKSLIQDVWEALVGAENFSALYLSDFKERFRLAELQNRLVNFSAETEAKGLIDDARIKSVISGDPLIAERKNQPPFVFRPFCKLVVCCNSLPATTDRTHGYFRRWLIIPCTQRFEGKRRDRKRAERIIQSELSGVLNWAIGGYRSLLKAGAFSEPESSVDALQEYRRQSDPVIEFVEECVRTFDTDDSQVLLLNDLYPVYHQWAKNNGYEPLGRNNLRKAVERVTGKSIQITRYGRAFAGMALL